MSTRKASCDRCHKRKEQCIGSPCQRCVKDGVPCQTSRRLKKIGRPKAERAPIRSKYSRHGCDACRKQKKKCDEMLPQCGRCADKKRECVYATKIEPPPSESNVGGLAESREKSPVPDFPPKNSHFPQNSPAVLGSQQFQSCGHQEPEQKLVQNHAQDGSKAAQQSTQTAPSFVTPSHLAAPCSPPTFAASVELLLAAAAPMEQAALTPSTLFNAIEQSFLECLENKPGPPDTASVYSSPAELSRDEYRDQKQNLLRLCSMNLEEIPAREGDLLCYFIQDVSMLLFADKTTPRFLATVIPLCLADERVRYPILAIASAHRRNAFSTKLEETSRGSRSSEHTQNLSNSTRNELVRDATRFRAMAQFCLAGRNDDYFANTENVLLSLCLVSIQEIFEGTSLLWSTALEKGAEIIRVRGGLHKVSRQSPLSIQLFCYLDHISSLSTCNMPHIDRTKNNPYQNYTGNHVEDILNCKFGFRFGIAGELFKIMGNISTLASLRADRYKTPEHGRQFHRLATLIEMELQNWAPVLRDVSDNFRIDGSEDVGKSTISSYLLAVQWACFLRLHQIILGYDRRDSRARACLKILLQALKSLSDDTEIETGLMFPLIMAGSVCVEPHDREYIISRVRSIKQKLQFSYIGEFERLLLAVWAQDAFAGDAVNWASIRFFEFPGLVMF